MDLNKLLKYVLIAITVLVVCTAIICVTPIKEFFGIYSADTTIVSTSDLMQDGDILQIGENCIKKNKNLRFKGTVNSMDTLVFRHGKDEYGSAQVVIDNTKVEVYNYATKSALKFSEEHGLNISGNVKVNIFCDNEDKLTIKISTASGKYKASKIFGGADAEV